MSHDFVSFLYHVISNDARELGDDSYVYDQDSILISYYGDNHDVIKLLIISL